MRLKRFRRVFTHYDKLDLVFSGFIYFAMVIDTELVRTGFSVYIASCNMALSLCSFSYRYFSVMRDFICKTRFISVSVKDFAGDRHKIPGSRLSNIASYDSILQFSLFFCTFYPFENVCNH